MLFGSINTVDDGLSKDAIHLFLKSTPNNIESTFDAIALFAIKLLHVIKINLVDIGQ